MGEAGIVQLDEREEAVLEELARDDDAQVAFQGLRRRLELHQQILIRTKVDRSEFDRHCPGQFADNHYIHDIVRAWGPHFGSRTKASCNGGQNYLTGRLSLLFFDSILQWKIEESRQTNLQDTGMAASNKRRGLWPL